jgi:hypothetical protein
VRGALSDSIKISLNKYAPVWWSRAVLFTTPSGDDAGFHAEDGAYFTFEYLTRTYSSLEGKDHEDVEKQRYPPGTMVAVWGYFPKDSADQKRTGRPINLCDATKTNKQRNPSCQQVTNSLGVGFELVTDQTPEEQTADNNEDYMTDNSGSEICATKDV